MSTDKETKLTRIVAEAAFLMHSRGYAWAYSIEQAQKEYNEAPENIRRALSGEPSPLQSSIALVDQLVQATERADAAERECRELSESSKLLSDALSTKRGARQAAEKERDDAVKSLTLGCPYCRCYICNKDDSSRAAKFTQHARGCNEWPAHLRRDPALEAECAKLREELASWQEEHRLCQGERNKAEAELARVKAAGDSHWSASYMEECKKTRALEAELAECKGQLHEIKDVVTRLPSVGVTATRASAKSSPGAEGAE